MVENAVHPDDPVPVGSAGRIGTGWWGLVCLVATEAALFVYLLFSYAYLVIQMPVGPTPMDALSFRYSLPATIVAVASSMVLWWGEGGASRGVRGRMLAGCAFALVLSSVFVALQILEWHSLPFTATASAYGSIFYAITGIHMAHAAAGVLALALVLLWSTLGYFDRRRHVPVLVVAAYWHFVNAAWVVFFVALYLAPHLG